MIDKIQKTIKKSVFIPHFFSIFHHSFIIRKGIYQWLLTNKRAIYGKVLDFGCGEKPYQQLFDYDEYIGVDIEVSGHDNSQNNVDVFRDGSSLPFENATFDSILATEVFEHVFNIDDILTEIHRVLKSWGSILITTPFAIHEHEVPYDFARYTWWGMQHLLTKHWFSIMSNQHYGSYRDTILQLTIWFLWKVTETKYTYLTLVLRIILVAPLMIVINILSLISPRMQKGMYLTNVAVAKKN